MNWLIAAPPTELVIGDDVYKLNTSAQAALWAWAAWYAYERKDIDEAAYAVALVENMYQEPMPPPLCQEAVDFASKYLNAFTERDGERKTRVPPIDILQDAKMISDAMYSLGIDIKSDEISYERFQALLQSLPEGCLYVHVMGLRVRYYDERHKMKPDELKRLNEQIAKIGKDIVKIRNSAAEREDSELKDIQNKKRAEAGLPPLGG